MIDNICIIFEVIQLRTEMKNNPYNQTVKQLMKLSFIIICFNQHFHEDVILCT